MDINDNDAIHGDEGKTDITSEEFKSACLDFVARLTSGDEDSRAIVIDSLISSKFFWDSIFSLSVVPGRGFDYNALINTGCSIQTAIYSEVMFQASKELGA